MNPANVHRSLLPNGLKFLIYPNPRVPLVSLNAFVRVGKDQNPSGGPGTASLTLRLLDEGTDRYSADQLSELIETAGGSLTTFSQRELSGVCFQLRARDCAMGMELLAEMIRRPTFPEDRVEIEKQRVLNQLLALCDDPQVVGSNSFNSCIYSGTSLAYPTLGTPESIQALQAEDLRRFHREKFAPENTFLVLVGALQVPETVEMVHRHFSDWNNPTFHLTPVPELLRQGQPVWREEFMDKEQLTIYLGHLGVSRNNPDYHALQVMDVILGGGPGFTSRIPRKLRDQQGLAYSTYADMTGSSGIYPGRFVAYISTSPENRERAVRGLLAEVQDLVRNGVSEEELKTAQDYLTGSFVFEFQSNASIARFLLACELFELGEDYAEKYPHLIRSVTREDVARVARQYLDTINYTTVIVGPLSDPSNARTAGTSLYQGERSCQ